MTIRRLSIRSTQRNELIDITREVVDVSLGIGGSALLVYVPHTTAGVLINEHADPDVARDLLDGLSTLVPDTGEYRHVEGNSPAHIKTTLVGTSQIIPLVDGRPALGTWQGIFLAEFDGPRTRQVFVASMA